MNSADSFLCPKCGHTVDTPMHELGCFPLDSAAVEAAEKLMRDYDRRGGSRPTVMELIHTYLVRATWTSGPDPVDDAAVEAAATLAQAMRDTFDGDEVVAEWAEVVEAFGVELAEARASLERVKAENARLHVAFTETVARAEKAERTATRLQNRVLELSRAEADRQEEERTILGKNDGHG